MNKEEGLRYNDGKVRMDLLEPWAIEKLAEVFTYGAKKYADHNWLKGMSWSKITASLDRHLSAYKHGVDFDEESGLLHAQHVAWNAMALLSYYKYHPDKDDRRHTYLKPKRIGLDIDEVLCDWLGGWCELRGIKERPHSWMFDRTIGEQFDKMEKEGTLDDFMLSLKPLVNPKEIPFEPHCYITARRVKTEVSARWLDENGFPTAPVYTVPPNTSKAEVAFAAGVDIFVDDNYKNFVELNNNGIFCYLYDNPHNRRYNVGARRIYSLKELG